MSSFLPGTFVLGALALTGAYVVLALILLSINFYSHWSWWVKAGATLFTSAFYFVAYLSIPPLLGWPTGAAPPERFHLIAAHVQEPDKKSGTEGSIYLWARDLAAPPESAPRAYRLPFSVVLHERVVEAGTKLRRGLPQLGEVEDAATRPGASAAPARLGNATPSNTASAPIAFYDLPAPLYPDK
jgi:hypothetical protein